jgi:mycothiol maleylpyruvate isomerase-like protein
MLEPVSTAQLLECIRAERSVLDESVAALAEERLSEPGVVGHWSVKDVLVHVTWWEQRTIEKLRGEHTAHDQLGGADNDQLLDIMNDEVYREHRDQPASAVKAAYCGSLAAISEALTSFPEDFVLANKDFIAENTYRHYPEHVAQIRIWLNQQM